MTILSLADYRALTGDPATDEDRTTLFLQVAQAVAERELGRFGLLELGDHTEELELYEGNIVYPTATPVADTVTGRLSDSSIRIAGVTVPWRGLGIAWRSITPERVTVHYVGGYDSTTAPYDLRLGLAKLTQALLGTAPGTLKGVPSGIKSVTVGDVSLTLASALGAKPFPPDVEALLCAYRVADAA